MTKHQSPTTEALKAFAERVSELANSTDGSLSGDGMIRLNAKDVGALADAYLALSRPSPIAEPQDSDAAFLRKIAAMNTAELFCWPDRLERIAARLEAPKMDALVERVIEAAQDVVTLARNEGVAVGNGNLVWGAAVHDLAAALQAIHEKKG